MAVGSDVVVHSNGSDPDTWCSMAVLIDESRHLAAGHADGLAELGAVSIPHRARECRVRPAHARRRQGRAAAMRRLVAANLEEDIILDTRPNYT